MKLHYYFRHLSRAERELLESVLMEELEAQTWYGVAWSALLGGETLITLQ